MHNDGRLGDPRAAAKDLLPVEQRQAETEREREERECVAREGRGARVKGGDETT